MNGRNRADLGYLFVRLGCFYEEVVEVRNYNSLQFVKKKEELSRHINVGWKGKLIKMEYTVLH